MTTEQRKKINEAKTVRDMSKATRVPSLELKRKIQRFNETILKRGRELMQEAADFNRTVGDSNDSTGLAGISYPAERYISDEAMAVVTELYNGVEGRLQKCLKNDKNIIKLHSEALTKIYRAG